MKTINQQIRKTNAQRRKALVKFTKKFHNETFSGASSYQELMQKIVEYKRLGRMALRGEIQ